MSNRIEIERAQHWVIKLGSNVLIQDGVRLDRTVLTSLIESIHWLKRRGVRVTLVTSGSVALGMQVVGAKVRPRDTPQLQALASLGQSRLMQQYEAEFAHFGYQVAQVLFSRHDLDDRERYLNARYALDAVHAYGAVPIINENDTVATEELKFGDNDRLAAMTCGLVQADLLVILSDVSGVLQRNEDGSLGERIDAIDASDPLLDRIAGPSQSGVGTGGMVSKIVAARLAARMGVATVIAPGKRIGVIRELATSKKDFVGTLLHADDVGVAGKKVWLGAGAMAVGKLNCDEGAFRAVTTRGASLLPSGVVSVDGEFSEGGVVDLVRAQDGKIFGRGIAVYGSDALTKIAGHSSAEIHDLLGFHILDAVVHRDHLVLLLGQHHAAT